MKRLFLFMFSAILVSVASWARTGDDIINDLRDAKHAQYVNVGKGLMGLARIFTQSVPGISSGVTSLRMLDVSDCKSSVRDKFRKQVRELYTDPSYEEMMSSEKDNSRSVVLMRGDGQYVDEIVTVQTGDRNDVIVVITGHISIDDINKVLDETGYSPVD